MLISELLDKGLQTVTLLEVREKGTLLDTKSTDYLERYHDADGSGGRWKEARIWLYDNKEYIGVFDCYDFPYKKEYCILFHEVT